MKKISNTIAKAKWYQRALDKIDDDSFTFEWLTTELLNQEAELAHDVMYTFLDLILEKEREKRQKIEDLLENVGNLLSEIKQ